MSCNIFFHVISQVGLKCLSPGTTRNGIAAMMNHYKDTEELKLKPKNPFFTSHALLKDLREAGYRATDTVRENRTTKYPLVSVKNMKKKIRAEFDYRFDMVNKISFVRWLDDSVCTMGTNCDCIHPLGKVKR